MKTLFLKKFFLFVLIFFVLDYTSGSVLQSIYKKVYTGDSSGGFVNGALASKADIIILGSSSAHHHYDPRIISKALGASVYNAGSDGMSYDFAYGLMALIGKDHRPKLWIMNVDSKKLLFEKRTAWRLAPHISANPTVRNLVSATLNSPIEKFRYASRLIRFNNIIAPLFKEKFIPKKNYNGYVPINGNLRDNEKQWFPDKLMIKPLPVKMLRNIATLAQQTGSEIIFTIGPRYYYKYNPYREIPDHEKKLLQVYKNIASELNITLLNHTASGIPEFYEAKFFRDKAHLNTIGSKIISEKLAQEIKYLINTQQLKLTP